MAVNDAEGGKWTCALRGVIALCDAEDGDRIIVMLKLGAGLDSRGRGGGAARLSMLLGVVGVLIEDEMALVRVGLADMVIRERGGEDLQRVKSWRKQGSTIWSTDAILYVVFFCQRLVQQGLLRS